MHGHQLLSETTILNIDGNKNNFCSIVAKQTTKVYSQSILTFLLMAKNKIKMKANLVFVGDIFPANLHYTIGFGVASQFARNNGKLWVDTIKEYFDKADISFGNLEAALISEKKCPQEKCFAGSTIFATFLKEVGINIVSLANNHILQEGLEGYISTKKALENNNIRYIGESIDGTSNIEIFEVDGIKIGLAGFNNIDIDKTKNRNVYAEYVDKNIIKALNIMASLKLDYKIISLHWGDEYSVIPSREQSVAAHKFVDFGADIIVGHHPHVIQPIERYKKGVIFYSLGNFIFDMVWSKKVRTGMVVNVTLEKGHRIKYHPTPVYIGNDYIPRKINNVVAHEEWTKKVKKRMRYHFPLSDKYYDKYYQINFRLNMAYQRIMMKVFLIMHWSKVSRKTKKILITSLLSKIKINKKP